MTISFATILGLMGIGGMETILILAVILIIFGPKKLPEFARGLGQSIKEFKKASNDVVNEIQNAGNNDHSQSPPPSNPTPKALPEPPKTEARSSTAPYEHEPVGDHKEDHEPVSGHKA